MWGLIIGGFIVVVAIALHVEGRIGLLSLIALLIFALFVGFAIANFGSIKKFSGNLRQGALSLENFEEQADKITKDKLDEIKVEVDGQKKQLSNVITGANKTREELERVAEMATETIGQLKSIACSNAEATITGLMASSFGFTDGLNLKSRIELHDQITITLKEIGVSEDEIKAVSGMWNKGIGVIYFRGISHALEGRTTPNIINKDANPELLRASREFQELVNFENWEAPTPDEMESFIEAKGFMNDEVKELLKDYRHFLITGEILRREVFEKL